MKWPNTIHMPAAKSTIKPTRAHTFRMMVTRVMPMEMVMPINGARKMKRSVLLILLTSTTSFKAKPSVMANAWAMAAPAKPPMSVWELEEGMPYHQVSRFQHTGGDQSGKDHVKGDEFTAVPFCRWCWPPHGP